MKKAWHKCLIKENMQRSINNKNKQMAHQLENLCLISRPLPIKGIQSKVTMKCHKL